MGEVLLGTLGLGMAAGFALALLEITYVFASAGASIQGIPELVPFCVEVSTLMVGGGLAIGLLEGLVVSAVGRAPASMRPPLYAFILSPLYGLFAFLLFSGRHAHQIGGRPLYQVLLVLVLTAATALGARWIPHLLPSRARSIVLVGVACALYGINQRLLHRLYPFFHVGLGLTAFATLELALFSWEKEPLRWRRRMVLASLPLALLGSLGSLRLLKHQPALRAAVVQRTEVAGRIVRLFAFASAAPALGVSSRSTLQLDDTPIGPHLFGINILVITVDAMRADMLNSEVTPELHRLVEQGIVFDRAYTQVPHTSFSIATLLTGEYIYSLSPLGLEAETHLTLPQVLRKERYKTAAFYPPAVFYIDHDRLAGFEKSAYGFEYVKYEYLPADKRTDQVISYLESEKPEQAFMWVHYFEPHEPYDVHEGLTQAKDAAKPSAVDRYRGEIRLVDREVGRLLADVKRTHPHTLVVLAADHGEEFGEHGGRYHGTTLYEEQVRVPLALFTLDGSALPRRHVASAVGLVDLAPTLLGLIDVPSSVKMRGHDLRPFLSDSPPHEKSSPLFAEIDRRKMVVDGDEKLICDFASDSCELYDLARDPSEKVNLVDDSARFERLRPKLDGFIAEQTQFEDARAFAGLGLSATEQVLILRGRSGDRNAADGLVALLHSSNRAVRREVASLVAALPADRKHEGELTRAAGDADEEVRRWAALALARATGQVSAALKDEVQIGCGTGSRADASFCARGALTIGDPETMGTAFDRVADAGDRELEVALAQALGKTHDPRALEPLISHLADVRTRREVAEALGELGDVRAIATIAARMPDDPYVPVRAEMAKALGRLAAHAPDADRRRAIEALRKQLALESEAPPAALAISALAALRDPEVWTLGPRSYPVSGPGVLWLAGAGKRTIDLRLGNEPLKVELKDEVARVRIAHIGIVRSSATPEILRQERVLGLFCPDQPTEASSQSR